MSAASSRTPTSPAAAGSSRLWRSPKRTGTRRRSRSREKRTDWSEYLDDTGEHRDGCGGTGADASDEAQKSKWSKYLDAGFFEERKRPEDSGLHWTELEECANTEATIDVVVDEEIHPDFI
nr:unnamed protein product [Digitaria exilis]